MQRVAYIEWIDAAIVATRWDGRDAIVDHAQTARGPIKSAGFVIGDDADGLVLALSVNENNDDSQLALFIPRSAIRHMSVWSPELEGKPT